MLIPLNYPEPDFQDVVLATTVSAKSVYLCVFYQDGYRHYLEFLRDESALIDLEHPFKKYYAQSVAVEAGPGGGGVTLVMVSRPSFPPFDNLTIKINISQAIYDKIVAALGSTIGLLVPPVLPETSGQVDFLLMTTDEGSQIWLNLVTSVPQPPESPITVETMNWREILFRVMSVPDYDFGYTSGDDLAMTFQNPLFCFLRQWVVWPVAWVEAIKDFSSH